MVILKIDMQGTKHAAMFLFTPHSMYMYRLEASCIIKRGSFTYEHAALSPMCPPSPIVVLADCLPFSHREVNVLPRLPLPLPHQPEVIFLHVTIPSACMHAGI